MDTQPRKWIELAKPGRWKAMGGKMVDLSAAIFREMVDGFEGPAPMSFGHVSKSDTSKPAVGAVTGLRLNGDVLEGEIDPAPELTDAIRNKRYFNRSIELDLGGDGKPAKFLGLAWLGHVLPAVRGLAPVTLADGSLSICCAAGNDELTCLADVESDDPRFNRAVAWMAGHPGATFIEAAKATAD